MERIEEKKSELRIELLTRNKLNDLHELLFLFAKETFNSESSDLLHFFEGHPLGIYVVYDGEYPVAFTSFCYNTYYGLRKPTIGNDYTFVRKEYRKSLAFHLLSLQAGAVIKNNGCNLEHYFSEDSGSVKSIGRVKGKRIYQTFEYEVDDVLNAVSRIKKGYERIKKGKKND